MRFAAALPSNAVVRLETERSTNDAFQAGDVFSMNLEGSMYGVGCIFGIPVNHTPEKNERVVVRTANETITFTVREIRKYPKGLDGVVVIPQKSK